ncbi:pirin family protein [Cesiribacter sp. SM1]|uniref:pirin family protein n=1 Tax=Cesiribacter sp. SM1 TaxID=2861196 RepID=UPI001CD70449|nr:pirin family protein [Cesiribacter sp. SM1]
MRTIKKQHKAVAAPIDDLTTYRALPTNSIEQIDPFLFLNHHGPQVYKTNNRGLPFGPHPHRGFETVTFILSGDIMHKDSGGFESTIEAGGVQWMTAGSGLIHAEVSSDNFKKKGGDLEILQLWVNLPAKHKMVNPHYVGLQQKDIPAVVQDDGKVTIHAVSGEWQETQGAFQPLADLHLATVDFKAGGSLRLDIAKERNVFFYVIRGKLTVNGQNTEALRLVEFNNDGSEISIEASADAIVLLGHAVPFNEPVVAQGPFVMNTEQEIMEAYRDFRAGKFGTWTH